MADEPRAGRRYSLLMAALAAGVVVVMGLGFLAGGMPSADDKPFELVIGAVGSVLVVLLLVNAARARG